MLKTSLTLLLSLVAVAAIAAAPYKWTDAKGVVHYSDQPNAGASAVDLPNIQGYKSPPARAVSTPSSNQGAADKRSVTITTPSAGQSFHAANGQVPVAVTVKPGIKGGEELVYKVDGQLAGKTPSTSTTLTNIKRGTHTLTVSLITRGGKQLVSATPVKFTLHQPSSLDKNAHNANQAPRSMVSGKHAFKFHGGS